MTIQQSTPAPIDISPEAHRALSAKVREWSGWGDARLVFGPTSTGAHATTEHISRTFTVNPTNLVLNPNRVLLTLTPFRLRQEAVLTGAVLHESGHARHTLWKPRTPEQLAAFVHGDGTPVTSQTFALASLMEEPRVEGLAARDADKIGAAGLGWTMRASAAHLIPTTKMDLTDPGQQIMDLITSWALRAGRQIALAHFTEHHSRPWVSDFTSLLHNSLITLFTATDPDEEYGTPHNRSQRIISLLHDMMWNENDRGTYMVDKAREVLEILFPETEGDEDEQPMPGAGCEQPQPEEDEESESEGGEEQESGASPSTDEDDAEPEEGGEDGAGEGEDEAEEGEQGEGEPEGQSPSDDGSDSPADGEPEPGEGEQGEGEGEQGEVDPVAAALAKALADMEKQADASTEEETEEEGEKAPPSNGAGAGVGSEDAGFRPPNADERMVANRASKFMRDLISPDESSKTSITDSPSSMVDGASLAAWRASGGVSDPHFFIRTRREVKPSPPVKIAVLVDISGSMDILQDPSALLSWALSSAALDLRNFAGRGQQIESTLIHWGSTARVIQRNGDTIPGISTAECWEGTQAMPDALDLVAEQIPGFFDVSDHPVNRLLVQFTDWDLTGGVRRSTDGIKQAMAAGVNMLSIVPPNYTNRWHTKLPAIMSECTIQRGRSAIVRYNPARPDDVWSAASEALR